jgi:hypothetical protein
VILSLSQSTSFLLISTRSGSSFKISSFRTDFFFSPLFRRWSFTDFRSWYCDQITVHLTYSLDPSEILTIDSHSPPPIVNHLTSGWQQTIIHSHTFTTPPFFSYFD